MFDHNIMIALMILLAFCDTGSVNGENAVIPKTPSAAVQHAESGYWLNEIALGMSPDSMIVQLARNGISVEMPNYDENPLPDEVEDSKEDGRIYNMTDFSFYFKAQDLDVYFTFSEDEKLCTISNWDAQIVSAEGLEIGCTVDEAMRIYGAASMEKPEEYSALQYTVNEAYLTVFYEDHIVTGWCLSQYPQINND